MRFLADMGISPQTVAYLKSLGHDATHLHEEGLDRLPDSLILDKAREENRVLLTHDLDFGELIAASGAELPSVVVFRLHNMRPNNVNHLLRKLLEQQKALLEQGAIVTVTDGQIRARVLPLRNNQ